MSSQRKPVRVVFGQVASIYGTRLPKGARKKEIADIFDRLLADRKAHLDRITSLEARNAQLEREERTNPLTGLPNYIALDEALTGVLEMRKAEYESHAEDKTWRAEPYTVIKCDINHFKAYNDTLGEEAADGLIKTFARLLKNAVRHSSTARRPKDFVARSSMAGDEFVILMPGATEAAAKARMEDINQDISSRQFLIETPAKQYFLVEHITFASGCYQLDSKPEKGRYYDKEYIDVVYKAGTRRKEEKARMQANKETGFTIRPITDAAELEQLQRQKDIIKVASASQGVASAHRAGKRGSTQR